MDMQAGFTESESRFGFVIRMHFFTESETRFSVNPNPDSIIEYALGHQLTLELPAWSPDIVLKNLPKCPAVMDEGTVRCCGNMNKAIRMSL